MIDSADRRFGVVGQIPRKEAQLREIPVHQIHANRYQPRSVFDDGKIEELAATIRTHGVIQPIVVRSVGDGYEIIAGERRFRAVQLLGHATIPALVRQLSDSQAASAALIENLQRENLTAIEEARAYQQLIEIHHLTQESLAQRLGRGQSTVANKLRLLHLHKDVQQKLMERKISERHGRALLSLNEDMQVAVLKEILEKDLNVKQTETRVKVLLENQQKSKRIKKLSVSKDVRLALNTIRQSLQLIKNMGMGLDAVEEEQDDYYQFTIRVPKRSD
ncbi:nucleoid occlusion protein [Ferroacidibacillus organovorans]|uniref:Nucleoid occlusion protein n=1 Tax=Ferroacidibacillus organovorans TaxID=1765683 RepID=A0A101XS59_9BACL|nr:nucleoid occlusion protein [Ferroacidibacillus organovorans]KUO96536.1 nucleoid occlusion protein [Ferroacidibacillus organovorans]